MSQNAPLLEMKNLRKDFFGNQVLTDINLTLGEGEVLGLVGENGAGKSTLMKILFGMDVIRNTGGYSGDILLNGQRVDFKTPFEALAAGIGMVHQEFSLIPGFTATEKNTLNTGNSVMRSYDVTITAKGDKVNYMATSKGVGKNELDAAIKAIQKADLSDLQGQLKLLDCCR